MFGGDRAAAVFADAVGGEQWDIARAESCSWS